MNLITYVLTGNYKEDQVHLPALLERLGEGGEDDDQDGPARIEEMLQRPEGVEPV